MDGVAQLLVVEGAVGLQVGIEDDGAEVADGGLLVRGVERDLRVLGDEPVDGP